MPRPTYTFDSDGHTVVAGDSAKKKERRCKMCGDELTPEEREVCSSCYTAEVTAGDVW